MTTRPTAIASAPGIPGAAPAAGPDPWTSIRPEDHDVRLVVCDMDGTLLTGTGEIPGSFLPLLDLLHARGITFVPASGRQYATLARMFGPASGGTYIAENGALVVHEGRALSTTCVDAGTVRHVIELTRAAAGVADLGLVVCGLDSAYIERRDPAFVAEAEKYYARLEVVDDLTTVRDDVLKLATYDFDGAEPTATTTFGALAQSHQVVVSGTHWIDIMAAGANKGVALRALQDALGVTPAQTVAFGDYLNDLELLDAAGLSFAMANAHPLVRARARYLAPTNHEVGVVTVLTHLLG